MITRILIILISLLFFTGVSAADIENINIQDVTLGTSNSASNTVLDSFVGPISEFFFTSGISGSDGLIEWFTAVAFQIKNIMLALAVIFLVIAIIKLLFSPNDEESVKKWRGSIIWTSVGIIVMQMAFSIWKTLILTGDSTIDSRLGWAIWLQIFSPIVGILQLLASFAFLLMMVYAFYIIVWGAGDEEKMKKWRRTIIYGVLGFFLMRFPEPLIRALYGSPNCTQHSLITIGSCEIEKQNISGVVGIIGKIITYFNGFLMLICVLLVIYAWWLVLISGGDEEKLKKAKSTILYVIIGLIVLVVSHALFRFFILKG